MIIFIDFIIFLYDTERQHLNININSKESWVVFFNVNDMYK